MTYFTLVLPIYHSFPQLHLAHSLLCSPPPTHTQGLIDSLMCGASSLAGIESMCAAVSKALSASGSYVVMTYGPPEDRVHLLRNDAFGWEARGGVARAIAAACVRRAFVSSCVRACGDVRDRTASAG